MTTYRVKDNQNGGKEYIFLIWKVEHGLLIQIILKTRLKMQFILHKA